MAIKAESWYEGADSGTPFSTYTVEQKKTLNFFEPGVNSNKYYTLELQKGNHGQYRLFSDYGRLGVTSTKQIRGGTLSLYEAEREFNSIVRQKTGKGYVEIELAQSSTGSEEAKKLIDAKEVVPAKVASETLQSNLDPAVRNFVLHIFEESGAALSSFISGKSELDKKAPLGKLSTKQISLGRDILAEIASVLPMGPSADEKIDKLSTEYRRNIPKAFGSKISRSEYLVNTGDKISFEMELLKFYEDSLRMEDVIVSDDVDKRYDSLKSDIWPIAKNSDIWQRLEHFMLSTQSTHHNVQLSVKRIFGVQQKNAPVLQTGIGNVRELFHGSRTANFPGILSSHLKLPTQLSGVHITGAMFGPGIYFADQSSKSTQYACARFGGRGNQRDTAFLFVADVALGKIKEEENSHYYYSPPAGYNSVKGVMGRSLLHNEYIVYDSSQQALRFIVEFSSRYK